MSPRPSPNPARPATPSAPPSAPPNAPPSAPEPPRELKELSAAEGAPSGEVTPQDASAPPLSTPSCGACAAPQHPSHRAELSRLRRIKGQLEGVERMIEEGRYCPDILVQTRAVSAAVRALEAALLQRHINHCVRDALLSGDEGEREAKVAELIEIFSRRLER